jgi:hypothetical protein
MVALDYQREETAVMEVQPETAVMRWAHPYLVAATVATVATAAMVLRLAERAVKGNRGAWVVLGIRRVSRGRME